MHQESRNITRRSALRLFLGGAGLAMGLGPVAARADTQSDLDAAQAQLDSAQAKLDQIGTEYEALAAEQSKTLDQIEDTNEKIDDTQDKIDRTQKDLDAKKERLSQRVHGAYKAGNADFLEVLLSAASFQELDSGIYYLDKISQSDANMIQQVKDAKAQLDEQKQELESEKADLEALSQTQQQQLSDMQAKQAEAQSTIDGLSQQVKDLMAKRDAEIQAAAEEAERQRKAAAAAAAEAARRQQGSGSSGGSSNVSGSISGDGATTGSQQRVISACHSTPSPGAGLCAMWVSWVFQNAGYGYPGGNANDMYNAWCNSSNLSALKPGMIVAVSTHSHTSAGRIYGHIGIYIGGGVMMDNVGYIRTIDVNSWISYYGTTVTPRWGWCMGIALS